MKLLANNVKFRNTSIFILLVLIVSCSPIYYKPIIYLGNSIDKSPAEKNFDPLQQLKNLTRILPTDIKNNERRKIIMLESVAFIRLDSDFKNPQNFILSEQINYSADIFTENYYNETYCNFESHDVKLNCLVQDIIQIYKSKVNNSLLNTNNSLLIYYPTNASIIPNPNLIEDGEGMLDFFKKRNFSKTAQNNVHILYYYPTCEKVKPDKPVLISPSVDGISIRPKSSYSQEYYPSFKWEICRNATKYIIGFREYYGGAWQEYDSEENEFKIYDSYVEFNVKAEYIKDPKAEGVKGMKHSTADEPYPYIWKVISINKCSEPESKVETYAQNTIYFELCPRVE